MTLLLLWKPFRYRPAEAALGSFSTAVIQVRRYIRRFLWRAIMNIHATPTTNERVKATQETVYDLHEVVTRHECVATHHDCIVPRILSDEQA